MPFLGLILAMLALIPPRAPTAAGFSPPTVGLGAGATATVQLTATGLSAGDTAAQFRLLHDPARLTVGQPTCTGSWAGADALRTQDAQGTWLACIFLPDGQQTGASGPVLHVPVTSADGSPQQISLDPLRTYFLLADPDFVEAPASVGTLTVTRGAPCPPRNPHCAAAP